MFLIELNDRDGCNTFIGFYEYLPSVERSMCSDTHKRFFFLETIPFVHEQPENGKNIVNGCVRDNRNNVV